MLCNFSENGGKIWYSDSNYSYFCREKDYNIGFQEQTPIFSPKTFFQNRPNLSLCFRRQVSKAPKNGQLLPPVFAASYLFCWKKIKINVCLHQVSRKLRIFLATEKLIAGTRSSAPMPEHGEIKRPVFYCMGEVGPRRPRGEVGPKGLSWSQKVKLAPRGVSLHPEVK
jgi:hypothetical protein